MNFDYHSENDVPVFVIGADEVRLIKKHINDILPPSRVKSHLTMAGVGRFFAIHDSEDEIR